MAEQRREPEGWWIEPGAGGGVVLRLAGEVDELDHDDVLRSVADLGPVDLRLDLGGVQFLGSLGLRFLLHLRERVRAAGGDVSTVAQSPIVARLLEITGCADQFPSRTTRPGPPSVAPADRAVRPSGEAELRSAAPPPDRSRG